LLRPSDRETRHPMGGNAGGDQDPKSCRAQGQVNQCLKEERCWPCSAADRGGGQHGVPRNSGSGGATTTVAAGAGFTGSRVLAGGGSKMSRRRTTRLRQRARGRPAPSRAPAIFSRVNGLPRFFLALEKMRYSGPSGDVFGMRDRQARSPLRFCGRKQSCFVRHGWRQGNASADVNVRMGEGSNAGGRSKTQIVRSPGGTRRLTRLKPLGCRLRITEKEADGKYHETNAPVAAVGEACSD